MLRICKELRSVADWRRRAPPKRGDLHWKDGRSAKELAKAWFPVPGDPEVPSELLSLLDSLQETRAAVFDRGEPERETVFDDCGGEPRNSDLVLWGSNPCGKVLVSIEAKGNESFGEIAGEYVRKSTVRNPRSRVPERFELLCRGVLGVGPDDEEARALRYQLLTAIAGTVAEAQSYGAAVTVFVVHEFVRKPDDRRSLRNSADLNRLVRLLSRASTDAISHGTLAGPFTVPGNKHFARRDLFIGKCRRVV
jgi:hypothetical protein